MKLHRRTFLATTAASVLLPKLALATPQVLRAEPVMAQILPETEPATRMLGLNGSTPGPTLRLREGERLSVRFDNQSGQGSALHWHGIRIDNAMDGVPGLTQEIVADGETFDYDFTVPDPGTYWYHSHARSWEQVERGIYGPLIVEEASPPAVDRDITVVIDDWRLERTGALAEDFDNRHDASHGGRLGNFARAMASETSVRQGDRVRLRLINAATARIFPLELTGADGFIVALDGRPLPEPQPIADLVIAPAQRVDIIANVTGDVALSVPTREGPFEIGRIAMTGENPAPISEPIGPLPGARAAMPPATPDQSLTLSMEGGAMGGRHGGSGLWSFNGTSGLTDTPFARFARGEAARITLVNDTAFPHGIHLHGHHFHEVEAGGSLGALRDTTLVNAGESRDIICVFDNPGAWMFHCHMLGHQAEGMKTWVEVV
ncbi:multicopper oxidase family protein [Gymnodinialimonas ceratoperidinii]|uniref:Multicopper oxidase family protein n=1 Tax=Gymnodinialimonas ceratoperidinii TaxID=2856823 RepID=A0A8F6TX06_9RHOB|nr:multicopper oxidase family protein [Gymnodinialimonas ceratoperidinii]QXT39479.1 multicopper oxidase family protein [Gymnodinialimonas ceratoperidinii]